MVCRLSWLGVVGSSGLVTPDTFRQPRSDGRRITKRSFTCHTTLPLVILSSAQPPKYRHYTREVYGILVAEFLCRFQCGLSSEHEKWDRYVVFKPRICILHCTSLKYHTTTRISQLLGTTGLIPCPCPTKKFRKYSTCMFSLFPETSPQRTLTLFHSFRIAGYFSIVALGNFFDSFKWCLSCLAQNLFEGVVLYDYLITFSSEVRCIWQRKLDVGTALLFIVRYTSLFEAPTYIVFSMFSPLQYMSPAKAESVRLFS